MRLSDELQARFHDPAHRLVPHPFQTAALPSMHRADQLFCPAPAFPHVKQKGLNHLPVLVVLLPVCDASLFVAGPLNSRSFVRRAHSEFQGVHRDRLTRKQRAHCLEL